MVHRGVPDSIIPASETQFITVMELGVVEGMDDRGESFFGDRLMLGLLLQTFTFAEGKETKAVHTFCLHEEQAKDLLMSLAEILRDNGSDVRIVNMP